MKKNPCKLKRELVPLLRQSLELTQAFIQVEYQGHALLLGLLWEGLAQYLCRQPRYRYLLGQVNLSLSALPVPKAQMLDFLRQHCLATEVAAFVRPRRSVRYHSLTGTPMPPTAWPADLDCAQVLPLLLASPAPGGMGVPVRLRPYFGRQARLLSVHLGSTGSNALCAAVLLDTATLSDYTYHLRERTAPQPPLPS